MADTCSQCGLPHELCVCDDMDVSETDVVVNVEKEERKHGTTVTLVKDLEEYESIDLDELETTLKSKFGCGGTVKNGNIELQGDHREKVKDHLENEIGIRQVNVT